MEEIAHDPVARRPVTSVAEGMVGAETAVVARGLPAVGAETHGTKPCRPIGPPIGPPRPPPPTPLRWDQPDNGCTATTAGCSASQYWSLLRGLQGGALRCGLGLLRLRSEEHTSELQSQSNLVCRLLLEKKKNKQTHYTDIIRHLA